MSSDEKPIVDWVNLPQGIEPVSLWVTLHDGSVIGVQSDLLARTVAFTFDVEYVREFHHLGEDVRFAVLVSGVQSVRSARSVTWPGKFSVPAGVSRDEESRLVAEYQAKWREESQSWSEFEQEAAGAEVSDATVAFGKGAVAIRLGVMAADDRYVEAVVRGDGITFTVANREVTPDEFLQLGGLYWEAFGSKPR